MESQNFRSVKLEIPNVIMQRYTKALYKIWHHNINRNEILAVSEKQALNSFIEIENQILRMLADIKQLLSK